MSIKNDLIDNTLTNATNTLKYSAWGICNGNLQETFAKKTKPSEISETLKNKIPDLSMVQNGRSTVSSQFCLEKLRNEESEALIFVSRKIAYQIESGISEQERLMADRHQIAMDNLSIHPICLGMVREEFLSLA